MLGPGTEAAWGLPDPTREDLGPLETDIWQCLEISGCHTGWGCCWHLVGKAWGYCRYPIVPRAASNRESPSWNVNCAKVEKPFCRASGPLQVKATGGCKAEGEHGPPGWKMGSTRERDGRRSLCSCTRTTQPPPQPIFCEQVLHAQQQTRQTGTCPH